MKIANQQPISFQPPQRPAHVPHDWWIARRFPKVWRWLFGGHSVDFATNADGRLAHAWVWIDFGVFRPNKTLHHQRLSEVEQETPGAFVLERWCVTAASPRGSVETLCYQYRIIPYYG